MNIINELNNLDSLLEIKEEAEEKYTKKKEYNELTKIKNEFTKYENNYYKRCDRLIKEMKNKSQTMKIYNIKMHQNILQMDIFAQNLFLPKAKSIEKEIGVRINSHIITKLNDYNLINNKLEDIYKQKIEYELLYRASEDGAFGKIFKKKCSNTKKTLIIVESKNNKKFGGFTEAVWNNSNNNYEDKNAFCFSIDKNKIYTIKNYGSAIFCKKDSGPIFCDIFGIKNKFVSEGGYSSNLEIESEKYEGITENYELAGEEFFKIKELEAFKIRIILEE